jgi:glycosyltransferase involved in cell wall biosynthesis
MKHRILVIAHGHPDFSLGGGELAAYNLFKAYADHDDVEEAFFLARADRNRGPTGVITFRRDREYLWEQTVSDWFYMKVESQNALFDDFTDLIRRLRPTLVHVHHYAHMGLECLQVIKRIDPSIKIMMTLHEYMAICFHNGQMVKSESLRLCLRESPDECARCFPDRSPEEFWLRKHRYQSFFALVDQFVSPSEFLRRRYIEWGIAPERIVTIENGQASRAPLPPRPLAEGEKRRVFGFFGQINPYKGILTLLQGLATLQRAERRNIVLEIHGSNQEGQFAEFWTEIAELRSVLEKEGILQWVGPYDPSRMAGRMAGVDWVLVPSIWWENSPMVIQEAFTFGRPVVCSDIGGMAEKVTDGVDGIHVSVANARAWGQTLLRLASGTEEWDRLRAGIRAPLSYAECAEAHLALIGAIQPSVVA